ncbi:MAG: hypothetical protein AAGD32_08150 [Planctomycetota bacterium]
MKTNDQLVSGLSFVEKLEERRLLSSGGRDPSWGVNGRVEDSSNGEILIDTELQRSNDVVLLTQKSNGFQLERLTGAGVPAGGNDSSFGDGSGTTFVEWEGAPNAVRLAGLEVAPDNSLIIGAAIQEFRNGRWAMSMSRVSPDGESSVFGERQFGAGQINPEELVLQRTNGELQVVVIGQSSSFGPGITLGSSTGLASFDFETGAAIQSHIVPGGGTNIRRIFDATVLSDPVNPNSDIIYAIGDIDFSAITPGDAPRTFIQRFGTDLKPIPFGSEEFIEVQNLRMPSIATLPDGSIVVAGVGDSQAIQSTLVVQKFSADGIRDETFGGFVLENHSATLGNLSGEVDIAVTDDNIYISVGNAGVGNRLITVKLDGATGIIDSSYLDDVTPSFNIAGVVAEADSGSLESRILTDAFDRVIVSTGGAPVFNGPGEKVLFRYRAAQPPLETITVEFSSYTEQLETYEEDGFTFLSFDGSPTNVDEDLLILGEADGYASGNQVLHPINFGRGIRITRPDDVPFILESFDLLGNRYNPNAYADAVITIFPVGGQPVSLDALAVAPNSKLDPQLYLIPPASQILVDKIEVNFQQGDNPLPGGYGVYAALDNFKFRFEGTEAAAFVSQTPFLPSPSPVEISLFSDDQLEAEELVDFLS